MKKYRRIINIAFCLYPDNKSSEGIVNFNWQSIILKHSRDIIEISQKKIIDYSKGNILLFKIENFIFDNFHKKSNLYGLFYKIVNRIYKIFFNKNQSLYSYLWSRSCYNAVSKSHNLNAVFWLRVLPVFPLKSLLKVYSKKKFPLVVNVNDPIVAKTLVEQKLNSLTSEQKLFAETKNMAAAWTFPSSKLSNLIAEKYNLDRERCFVIPHAYTPFKTYYTRIIGGPIKLLYTGTFYKSAFTKEFRKALQQIQKLSNFKNIEFTFVLSQYDDNSIKWLKESLPNVKLKFKLDRSEVLRILKKSDLVIVIDAETHIDLLKGKLVEAISYGIPVYAPTYKGSIMDKVVSEYGCFAAYQEIEDDLNSKLITMISNLDCEKWLKVFYSKREQVIEKFSEKHILNATFDITEFAYQRFKGNMKYEIDKIYNWP